MLITLILEALSLDPSDPANRAIVRFHLRRFALAMAHLASDRQEKKISQR